MADLFCRTNTLHLSIAHPIRGNRDAPLIIGEGDREKKTAALSGDKPRLANGTFLYIFSEKIYVTSGQTPDLDNQFSYDNI